MIFKTLFLIYQHVSHATTFVSDPKQSTSVRLRDYFLCAPLCLPLLPTQGPTSASCCLQCPCHRTGPSLQQQGLMTSAKQSTCTQPLGPTPGTQDLSSAPGTHSRPPGLLRRANHQLPGSGRFLHSPPESSGLGGQLEPGSLHLR